MSKKVLIQDLVKNKEMDMNELTHLKVFYTVTKKGQLRTHTTEEEGGLSPPYLYSFVTKLKAFKAYKNLKKGK